MLILEICVYTCITHFRTKVYLFFRTIQYIYRIQTKYFFDFNIRDRHSLAVSSYSTITLKFQETASAFQFRDWFICAGQTAFHWKLHFSLLL